MIFMQKINEVATVIQKRIRGILVRRKRVQVSSESQLFISTKTMPLFEKKKDCSSY